MPRFKFNGLALLAVIFSLLVAGCSADATPTPLPTPTSTPSTPPHGPGTECAPTDTNVFLTGNNFTADLPIATTVALTGFQPGEMIEVLVIASDGSQIPSETTTANDGCMAAVDIRHDGLPKGMYLIGAEGDGGGKASAALYVK